MATRNPTRRAARPAPNALAAGELKFHFYVGFSEFKGTGQQLVEEGFITLAMLRAVEKNPAVGGTIRADGFGMWLRCEGDGYALTRFLAEPGAGIEVLRGYRRHVDAGRAAAAAYVEAKSSKDKAFNAFTQRLLAA